MMSEKYSHRDFTGQSLADVDPAELNGTEIVGSYFYRENAPDTHIFPAGIHDVTFRGCNLDNVFVPPGNTVADDCTHKRIKCFPPTPRTTPKADDLPEGALDWIVDKNGKPVEPLHKWQFEAESRSVDPKDIPDEHEIEVTVSRAEYDAITKSQWEGTTEKGNKPLKDSFAWFKEKPRIVSTIPTDVGDFLVVRGKAWLYRGETQADVDDRKRKLADVRKVVK